MLERSRRIAKRREIGAKAEARSSARSHQAPEVGPRAPIPHERAVAVEHSTGADAEDTSEAQPFSPVADDWGVALDVSSAGAEHRSREAE